jgi:hypothetical protein
VLGESAIAYDITHFVGSSLLLIDVLQLCLYRPFRATYYGKINGADNRQSIVQRMAVTASLTTDGKRQMAICVDDCSVKVQNLRRIVDCTCVKLASASKSYIYTDS